MLILFYFIIPLVYDNSLSPRLWLQNVATCVYKIVKPNCILVQVELPCRKTHANISKLVPSSVKRQRVQSASPQAAQAHY